MIPQIVKYFRFDSYTDEFGEIYYAPPNFKNKEEYYEGYDLAPYTISYNIKRDVDFEPDTFTIVIDPYFFQNPTNNSSLSTKRLVDDKNAFEPSVNHVIVIGPLPDTDTLKSNNGNLESYNYEVKLKDRSSPVFGFVKNFTRSGNDKITITCISFLKVLNEFQLGTNFKLNSRDETVNALQIYYEYNDVETESSDPYFASKDLKSVSASGEYRIISPIKSYDDYDYTPLYPRFKFVVNENLTIEKEGYEAPKIAWRLLQEVGWCRDNYKNEILNSLEATPYDGTASTGLVNPYQDHIYRNIATTGTQLYDEYINKYGLIITSTEVVGNDLKFKFSSFVCDGLQYDYEIMSGTGSSFINTLKDLSISTYTWTDFVFIKQKTLVIPDTWVSGYVTTYFELKGNGTNPATQVYGRIYKNGTAIGPTHIMHGQTWEGFTDNIPGLVEPGDTIELWCYQHYGTGDGGSCRNFTVTYYPNYNITQTYYGNYDPSRQSILYNLKNIADSDSLYLTVTCCPRIAQTKTSTYPTIVWDYTKVYGGLDNLKRWGVSAGFRPKLLLRRNIASSLSDLPTEFTQEDRTLKYGVFLSSTEVDDKAVLAKSIKWDLDQTDVINRLLIKYGQGSNEYSRYVEIPTRQADDNYFYLELTGSAVDSATLINLTIHYSESGVYSINRTYPVGTEDYQILRDLQTVYNKNNVYFTLTSSGNVMTIKAKTGAVKSYWNSNQNSVVLTIKKLSAMTDEMMGYNLTFIETEPIEYTLARESQKRNGVRAAKISLPEVSEYKDVLFVSSRIFKKLSNEKFKCTVQCNDIENWQLPIFKLYRVQDFSNTKQVLNDKGARIKFRVYGTAGADGVIFCILPHPDVSNHFGFVTNITSEDTASVIAGKIVSTFNVLTDLITATQVGDDGEPSPTGTTVVFQYDVQEKFPDNYKFDIANISTIIPNVRFYRYVESPGTFKQAAYDELLMLLQTEGNSKNSVHTCVFGLPSENLANIINQSINWISDIEKGQ